VLGAFGAVETSLIVTSSSDQYDPAMNRKERQISGSERADS
jgi:hypothetical protein